MSKHTPGPWKTEKSTCTFWNVDGPPSELRLVNNICSVWAHASSTEEARANAGLIAAAPDLLEALEECASAIENDLCPGQDERNECWALLKRARAAIAKAKGETL